MAKKELESKIQRRAQKIITDNGGFVIKTHGDQYSRPGIPDLICCIPSNLETIERLQEKNLINKDKIGIFVAFEMKQLDKLKETSKAQFIVGKEITNAGGIWDNCDDTEQIEFMIKLIKGELCYTKNM